MSCCSASRDGGGVQVRFPDGTTKTFVTRSDALTAIGKAGGGVILS